MANWGDDDAMPPTSANQQPLFEDAIAPVILMLNRIYDMLTIIAANADEKVTEEMVNIHSKGGFFGPPPGFDPEYQRELDARD